MRHKKIYSIILLFLFINCNYTALGFSSLFKKPSECNCNDIVRGVGVDYKDYANIFAGIGCVIDNPIAYYLRILVDVFAWYFRFSKVKNESGYYKTYYGTELGVAFFHSRKYSNVQHWLELNFNLLSWLLFSPYVFITNTNINGRLAILLLSAIFFHSSIFMCNFSLLKKHLEIHAVNIMQIFLCLFIQNDNYNCIRVVKKTFYSHDGIADRLTQTHYKFGGLLKRNLPITYIYKTRGGGENSDRKAEVIITILNALLPCISIII